MVKICNYVYKYNIYNHTLCAFVYRYYAIKSPFTYNGDKIRSKLICMFIWTWVLGFVTQIPHTVHLYPRYLGGKYRCLTLMIEERWIGTTILCVGGGMSLFVPGGIMFYVYTKMGLILYSGRKMSHDDTNSTSSARMKSLRKAHSNILQTCILLSIFYLITYAAYAYQMFVFVFADVSDGGAFQTIELYLSQYMISLNSWINPFIYAVR